MAAGEAHGLHRDLMGSQVLDTPVAQVRRRNAVFGAERHSDPLAREGIQTSEYDRVGHARHRHHHVFDFLRIDVEARDVDGVIEAPDEHQRAIGLCVAEIGGPDCAVTDVDHDLRG